MMELETIYNVKPIDKSRFLVEASVKAEASTLKLNLSVDARLSADIKAISAKDPRNDKFCPNSIQKIIRVKPKCITFIFADPTGILQMLPHKHKYYFLIERETVKGLLYELANKVPLPVSYVKKEAKRIASILRRSLPKKLTEKHVLDMIDRMNRHYDYVEISKDELNDLVKWFRRVLPGWEIIDKSQYDVIGDGLEVKFQCFSRNRKKISFEYDSTNKKLIFVPGFDSMGTIYINGQQTVAIYNTPNPVFLKNHISFGGDDPKYRAQDIIGIVQRLDTTKVRFVQPPNYQKEMCEELINFCKLLGVDKKLEVASRQDVQSYMFIDIVNKDIIVNEYY